MAIIVKGGGGKPEEEKTVTAGTSVIEVNPSSGKAMKKVIVNPTPTESKSVTPTTSELTVTPSEGKHLSQVVVGAVEDVTPEVTAQTPVITQILEGLVGKAQGANATADKILEGYSAYVGGVLVDGTFKPVDVAALFGCAKYAVDEFTLASDTYNTFLSHSLGRIPTIVFIFTDEKISVSGDFNYPVLRSNSLFLPDGSLGRNITHTVDNSGKGYVMYHDFSLTSTDSQIQVRYESDSYYLKAGVKYTLITMA